MSAASRETFASLLFAKSDYRLHSFEENRFELLQSNDSMEMLMMINVFEFFLADSANLAVFPELIYQRDRLLLTLEARQLYLNGLIDMKEVHKRLVNNYLFDQINMGTQNFVLAVFQHLVKRTPTQFELQSANAMVDGINSAIFSQAGNSKEDFIDIVLQSLDYHEGQIIGLYEKYLLRIPDTQEMVNATQTYYLNNDYIKVQKELIKTNEFAGLN
jgi:hypothetical protein